MNGRPVAVVTPVYLNESTLPELAARVAAALDGPGPERPSERGTGPERPSERGTGPERPSERGTGPERPSERGTGPERPSERGTGPERPWRLRFVVDASPDASLAVASGLAAADGRLAVTALAGNVGQNRALLAGLAAEEDAGSWVCLDADLQDPPEAVPLLLERLAAGDVGVVFAGRRGAYESRGRMLTGAAHRAVLSRLTGVPADAGAFLAMDRRSRNALLALDPPSIVAGVGAARIPAVSVPVARVARVEGRSAWTASARLRQSGRTLAWAWRARA